MSLDKYIIVGGLVWLYISWKNKAKSVMKHAGIEVGDDVISKVKDSFGKYNIRTGKVFIKNDIPYVKLTASVSGKNVIPWDETFIKNK